MNKDNLIDAITVVSTEDNNLLRFIRSLNLSAEQKILDVGCGFGEKMELLRSHGFKVIGVDVNREIIAANVAAGLSCMTIEDFNQTNELFDLLLMSHLIEHFQPENLLKLMDDYLDRLKTGGYLIITTPLSSPYFYEDFDHVKPYHPTGINMVFGNNSAQVQYYSRNKLELREIWFRKGPFKNVFAPGLYLKNYSKTPVMINLLLALLFKCSFGLIGRTDGWMGLYRKVANLK